MAKRNFDKRGGGRDKEPKEFEEEVLQIDRVTRVVKGGRRLRFRVLIAIGDKKGRVSIGIGKASEVVNGIKKAITQAKKSLLRIPITENGSIPHDVNVKYKASKIMIMPAMPGTGIIAGGSLRKILMLAGVKNVFGKRFGSNNRMVTAQAAMLALAKLRPVRESKKPVLKEAPKAETPAPKKGVPHGTPEAHAKQPSAPAKPATPAKEAPATVKE
jgi:small subunit ribosomal protein S5